MPVAERNVDVLITISEGAQYRLPSLRLSGIKFFNSEHMAASYFDVQPGDIVNLKQIRHGLERLQQVYDNCGFLNWSYTPEQTFDDNNNTVALSFTIQEGVQYSVAYITFAGCQNTFEEERLRADIYEKPGDVFSPLKFQVDALRLKVMHGIVKESMQILDSEKGIVGVVFWLPPHSKD